MSFLRHHIVLMFFYAAATGVFFAALWKEDRQQRIRTFITIFCALFFECKPAIRMASSSACS